MADLAQKYLTRLDGETAIADVCFTANAGRSHFDHRLAVVGASVGDLHRGLESYCNAAASPNLAVGVSDVASRPRVAFLFTGQGAQYAGMGRALYETSPVFRQVLDECAAGTAAYLDHELLEIMFSADDDDACNHQ